MASIKMAGVITTRIIIDKAKRPKTIYIKKLNFLKNLVIQ